MKKDKNLYSVWVGIRKRCYSPKNKAFKYYGARGIGMCNEWKYSYEAFAKWAMDNGWKRGLEFDRYPNKDGNYEPSNCRIVTKQINLLNQRRHGKPEVLTIEQAEQIRSIYTAGGITQKQLSDRFNASLSVIYRVLKHKTYIKPIAA